MIVVAGAGGFIGTYLVDAMLEEGFEVLAVDTSSIAREYYSRKGVSFAQVDITKKEDLRRLPDSGVEAVINVACLQPVNVNIETYRAAEYIEVNVVGTLNLLDYCLRAGTRRFLYTVSHRGVQGLWVRGEIIDENSVKALKFTGEYAMFAISECAAQDCLEHYVQQYGIQAVVLRLPPVYGYGPHLEGYREGKPVKSGFMVFIEKAMASETIELWGDCDRARDVVYVKDVVSAIVLTLRNREARGLYNISSGESVSLRQEAEEIIRVFSPADNPSGLGFRPEQPNSVEPFQYDITKARKDLQWFPRYLLHDMLVDFKSEMESGRFEFLVEKRRRMFAGALDTGSKK
jgi:UDP-glucose 4-epimerase